MGDLGDRADGMGRIGLECDEGEPGDVHRGKEVFPEDEMELRWLSMLAWPTQPTGGGQGTKFGLKNP